VPWADGFAARALGVNLTSGQWCLSFGADHRSKNGREDKPKRKLINRQESCMPGEFMLHDRFRGSFSRSGGSRESFAVSSDSGQSAVIARQKTAIAKAKLC
jgi:hypothetical protein